MAETPPAASIERDPPTATVADHRPVPRGVLPRGVQTWVMAGVAVGMLAIMLIVGRPDPPARPATTTAPAQAPSADRVRDYQDRLRLLEAQAMRDAQAGRAGAERPAGRRTTTRSLRRRRIRSRPIESGVNTRASLPATSF